MEKKLKKFTVRLVEEDHLKLIYQAKKLNLSQAQLLRELIKKGIFELVKSWT